MFLLLQPIIEVNQAKRDSNTPRSFDFVRFYWDVFTDKVIWEQISKHIHAL